MLSRLFMDADWVVTCPSPSAPVLYTPRTSGRPTASLPVLSKTKVSTWLPIEPPERRLSRWMASRGPDSSVQSPPEEACQSHGW